jgi:ribosome biogenesis GTPase
MLELMVQGVVTKSTGSWYEVKFESGEVVKCRLKGVMRLDESNTTNPVAVGDKVQIENFEADWVIASVATRDNYIIRVSPKHEMARQVIAANLDQVILVATLALPRTSTGFIDRFLLTAEAYHIPTIIVFNKQDALPKKHQKKQDEIVAQYRNIGYKVLLTSAQEKTAVDELAAVVKNKTSLIAGHSGVGKSSLLNAVQPSLQLTTKAVSTNSGKGMHTTTFAEMHFLDFGGSIIDTPGVREFGITGFQPEEVSHYFVEMRPFLVKCKFNNCLHTNEPDCAVQLAVANGKISEERFGSYLNILADVQTARKEWE